MKRMRSCAGLVAVVLLVLGTATAEDWPQFRGVARDGVSSETGLARSWPESGPPVRWNVDLGAGYSGLAVVDGRLFTLFSEGKDEFAVSLDAATGEERWRKRIDDAWNDRMGDGPRSTPTVDGERVYALSSGGKLWAFAAAGGDVVWSLDLRKDYAAKPPRWGASTSPLVEGKLLIVDAGGGDGSSVVAFDKTTGKEVWRSQDDKPGYSAPIAITVSGVRQVIVFTGSRVVSLAPQDGSLYWDMPWKTAYDVNAATPVFVPPDKLFVSSGYDHGAVLLRLEAADGKVVPRQVWDTRTMKNQFSSSVLHDGHLYGFDDKTLRCIAVETAETKWRERGFGHGSLLYADGHLIVLGDDGRLALIEATAAGYRLRSSFQLFDAKTWTMPTLVDGTLYVRDEKRLVALDVSE